MTPPPHLPTRGVHLWAGQDLRHLESRVLLKSSRRMNLRRRLCVWLFLSQENWPKFSPHSSRMWMSVTSSFSTSCRMYLPVLISMCICSPNDPIASLTERKALVTWKLLQTFLKSLQSQLCQDRLVCFVFDEINIILWIQKHWTLLSPTYLAGPFFLQSWIETTKKVLCTSHCPVSPHRLVYSLWSIKPLNTDLVFGTFYLRYQWNHNETGLVISSCLFLFYFFR